MGSPEPIPLDWSRLPMLRAPWHRDCVVKTTGIDGVVVSVVAGRRDRALVFPMRVPGYSQFLGPTVGRHLERASRRRSKRLQAIRVLQRFGHVFR